MPVRSAEATWRGTLRDGDGDMAVESGAYEGRYSYSSRFEEDGEAASNPEELIGGAHAGCFSMALAADLEEAGYDPEEIHTTADVTLREGAITKVDLVTEATVPDVDDAEFQEIARGAKENCPVSRALTGGSIEEITLDATLN